MEKRLLKVVIFSLCLAGLTTRWLNQKAAEVAHAPKTNKVRASSKTKLSEAETSQRPAIKNSKNPLTTSIPAELIQSEDAFGTGQAPRSMESALNDLSKSLYLPGQDFEAQERELKAMLSNSTTTELRPLAIKILSPGESQDLRMSAAYMLNLAGPSAIPLLTEIASTSFRETGKGNFEAGLRAGALQRLDQWAKDGQPVEKYLREVLRNQTNPALKLFARTSLEGIIENKPGKLLRLSQKSLEEF